MSVNERIRLIRCELNLSQRQFAEKLEIRQSILSQIEKGSTTVSARLIKNICSACNVSENWIKTGEGDMFI